MRPHDKSLRHILMIRTTGKRPTLPVCLLLFMVSSAQAALTIDHNAPIEIEADSAVIDEPSGSAVYRGKVVLKQGLIKLQSGELTLYIKDGKALKAVATGKPAVLNQAPTATDEAIHAQAHRITFLIEENRMLLDNQAALQQGGRLFQGAHIDYDIAARRVKADGAGASRVLLVLPPTAAKEKSVDQPNTSRLQTVLPPAPNNTTNQLP